MQFSLIDLLFPRITIALLAAGHRQGEISYILRPHKSTIHPKVRPNRGYRPKPGHQLARKRHSNRVRPPISVESWQPVESLICRD